MWPRGDLRSCIFYLNVNDAFCATQDLRGEARDLDTLRGAGGEHMPPPTSIGLVKLWRFLRSSAANLWGRWFSEDRYGYLYTEEAANWSPDEQCIEHFQKNVEELTRLSLEIDCTPVFVLPPWIFRSHGRLELAANMEKRIFGFENSQIPYLFGRMFNWRTAQYPVLLSAKKHGAIVVDMRDLIEDQISERIDEVNRFTYDGSHMTAEGAALFGEVLARNIHGNGILKQ